MAISKIENVFPQPLFSDVSFFPVERAMKHETFRLDMPNAVGNELDSKRRSQHIEAERFTFTV
jgi:hypothetical protein